MSGHYRRDIDDLARRYGRTVEMTKSQHLKLTKDGKQFVITSLTPHCPHRELKNTEALLKRYEKE